MRRLEDALKQVELKGKRREGMKAKIKGCVSLSLFLCFLLFVCHHLGQRVFERNMVGRTVYFGGGRGYFGLRDETGSGSEPFIERRTL